MAKKYTPHQIPEKIRPNKVSLILDFLSENYEIKISSINPDYSSIKYKDSNKGDKCLKLSHIYLDMESAGITGYRTIIKDLIAAGDILASHNPIMEYLEEMSGKWQGVSHIDILCEHLVARNFEDKEDETYYQKRANRILKKWLVACVANYYGEKANDTILGLMSLAGGIGKTTFFQNLIPERLSEYYFETKKDAKTYRFAFDSIFTTRMLNQFEELNGIKRSNINEFKQILSAKTIEVKTSFGLEKRQRVANAAFTSNQVREMGGFMYELMNDRRFAIIELETIEKNYMERIDIDQVWAEAVTLFKSTTFDYVWNSDDYKDFINYNRRYEKETEATKLIKRYYEQPTEATVEQQVFMTAADILRELVKYKKVSSSMNISDVSIGRALNTLDYRRTSATGATGYTIKGYYVISRLNKGEQTE